MSAQLKQFMLDLITDAPDARAYTIRGQRGNKNVLRDGGVCLAIRRRGLALYTFHAAIKDWPQRVGMGYPVPAPSTVRREGHSELCAARDAYDTLPHWEGEYGESRKDMCRWVITWLDQRDEQAHAKPVL